jgi:hypothetical protein
MKNKENQGIKKLRVHNQMYPQQAERTGFEPVEPQKRFTGLAILRIRPLCHLSDIPQKMQKHLLANDLSKHITLF